MRCKSLENVIIPPSVTIIEDNLFKECYSLKKVVFGSITSIKSSAFESCSSLCQIILPPTVKMIEKEAFKYCSSLKEISIPSSVSIIKAGTFYDCIELTKIEISSSITAIDDFAFNGSISLVEISIPSSVTSIGKCAFRNCSSLETLSIPLSVAIIDESTFECCTSLKDISLPSSISIINKSTFRNCSSLVNLTIPPSVETIGKSAFSGCSSLNKVIIPPSVLLIDSWSFFGCSISDCFPISSSKTKINEGAFFWCSSNNLNNIISTDETQNDQDTNGNNDNKNDNNDISNDDDNKQIKVREIDTNAQQLNMNNFPTYEDFERLVSSGEIVVNSTWLVYFIICLIKGINRFPKDIRKAHHYLEHLYSMKKKEALELYCSFISENFLNISEKIRQIQVLSEEVINKNSYKARLRLFDIMIISEFSSNKQSNGWQMNKNAVSLAKLIPKFDPVCTFSVTGMEFIDQKLIKCETCGFTGSLDVCEVCANHCHKGHQIKVNGNGPCYCDCGINPMLCKCIPKEMPPLYTNDQCFGLPVKQPMYQCIDCGIDKLRYICQYCAKNCHKGHKLKYIGVINEKCSCFEICGSCKASQRRAYCTNIFTGKNGIEQSFYHCITCNIVNSKGICVFCAQNCHKHHELKFVGFMPYCTCSCKNCIQKCQRKIDPIHPNLSYLIHCTNLNLENDQCNENGLKEQRMYSCITCGIKGIYGLCEACAINCKDQDHEIIFMGIRKFKCCCKEKNKCKMNIAQTLRDSRVICDRRVLKNDECSPCYICSTCDKNGRYVICEICALKNHLDHEIHFIGNISFECNENRLFF